MSTTAPQALKSLYIPAMTTLKPTEHYAGGIPIRAVENGLQIIVPAWYSMDLGHKVEVFCFGTVLSKTLEHASELNRDVVFTLAKGFVVDGDAADIYYKITIKNQVPEESKPRWTLLVKLTRPGEYDDIGGDDGHSDFNFTLDRYVVDDKFTQNDVVTMRIVTYRNLTKYDRIRCRWGSQEVVHDVTPEQALDPLNHPIDIFFNYNLIKAAGDGSAVAVAFQVVDRCGNYPDERAPWSALQRVVVDMNGDRLDSPLVLVKGQPTDRVDLDTLGDDDVIVRVYTTAKDFALKDEVLLTWTGTPAQGPQIIVGPLSKTVDFVPFQLDFIIPNEAVRAIAKGSASVGFVRRREGESDRTSKNASVSVVGDISQLLAPTVVEAPGGTLPVDTPWATVSIPWYVGRNGSDLLNVIWEAKAPGGDPVYYEDPRPVGNVAEGEPVLRNVSKTEIQRFDGLSVKVYYVVTNRDNLLLSVRESLPFIMQVGVAKPTFDRPEVVEADDNDVLDPDNVPPTGATLVLTHTGTQDKDRFNFNWKGSASGGSFSDHIDLIPVTAGKPVRVTVPKQYVTANSDGTVVADYKIERGGETLGYSRELKLRIGVALDLKDPEIKEAPNNILQPIAAKDTLTAVVRAYPDMIGTQVSVTWTGTPGEGSKTEGPVNVTMQQDMEIPLLNSLVAFNLGKTVKVIYTVIRNGVPQDSEELILTVLPITDGDQNLPTPSIDGAVGDELDVTRLEEGAQLRIEKWMLQAVGQCVWLRFDGTDKNGNPVELVFWAGAAHQQASGLVTAARVAWLRGLKDETELTITFKLNFDKVANIDTAVGFPVKTYTVKAGIALEIDTTPMLLDGVHMYLAPAPYTPPLEATDYLPDAAYQTREAHGGVPPYKYISSATSIASVDPDSGYVVSTGNGTAIISVHDAKGASVSYQVTCKHVYELVYTSTPIRDTEYYAWLGQIGANYFWTNNSSEHDRYLEALRFGFQKPLDSSWVANIGKDRDYTTTMGVAFSTGDSVLYPERPGFVFSNAYARMQCLGYRIKTQRK
ncbi:hypothetical protein [Pseudomonas helmanticensis]|uniref:hypothetical protein n=1 Tax=Pseudomonas helmanticensis TaxID=1471381 RepID=UPI0038275DFE